jgi:hypothetical protein
MPTTTTTIAYSTGNYSSNPLNNLTMFLIMLALVVMFIGSWSRILAAGGFGRWAVLVPGYNLYAFVRVAGRSGWWALGLLVPGFNFVVGTLCCIEISKRFGRGRGFGYGLAWLGVAFAPWLSTDRAITEPLGLPLVA